MGCTASTGSASTGRNKGPCCNKIHPNPLPPPKVTVEALLAAPEDQPARVPPPPGQERNQAPSWYNELKDQNRKEEGKGNERRQWGADMGDELQRAMDSIFNRQDEGLTGLEFSFTIADPHMDGCPLIGCSTGFSTLCGYEMSEIVGKNCRFLIEPVPKELVNPAVRKHARDFCNAAIRGEEYALNNDEKDDWMPLHKPGELFCVQMNARKDGTLFKNMFYMRLCDLNDHKYVVALQTEMTDAVQNVLGKAAIKLTQNMQMLEEVLAKQFWYSGPMRRQELLKEDGENLIGELAPL